MKFKEWFINRLQVGRYPLPGEIIHNKFDYIINVSDEYISYCHNAAIGVGTKYFWFPMNEKIDDMGLNSLYAALQILTIAEQENATVLLHCHAGANRSQMVRDAYYFMKTKTHLNKEQFNESLDKKLDFYLQSEKPPKNNRLISNVEKGHLPSIYQIEKFLKCCEVHFQQEETMRKGGIDICKLASKVYE